MLEWSTCLLTDTDVCHYAYAMINTCGCQSSYAFTLNSNLHFMQNQSLLFRAEIINYRYNVSCSRTIGRCRNSNTCDDLLIPLDSLVSDIQEYTDPLPTCAHTEVCMHMSKDLTNVIKIYTHLLMVD